MNALQISPLGATAPPTSPGKDPAAAEVASSLKPKIKFKPDVAGPESGTEQQLAEVRAHTINERKAQAEKAQAERAAKEAAARKKAQEEAVTLDIATLDREVGLVEGTTKVFVDLVDPVRKTSVFRVFGPPENAAETPAEPPAESRPAPAGAANAYTLTGATLPLKDLGVA